MNEPELVEKGFRVTGRVQGVFFRAWAREVAEALGVGGTVQNRPDGSVEVHAVGRRGALEEFEERLWKGPPAAAVSSVEEIGPSGGMQPRVFRVLR